MNIIPAWNQAGGRCVEKNMNPKELEHHLAWTYQNPHGDYITLTPSTRYPTERYNQAKHHERRWLHARAAALTCRGSVISGRAAARLLGMWVIATSPETIEVAQLTGGASPSLLRSEQFHCHRWRLKPRDILTLDGCQVTTRTRTFVDIARTHGFLEGLLAADWILAQGLPLSLLRREVQRLGRLKGIATVRKCLEHAVPNSDSAYESYARGLLIDAHLGPITVQHRIGRYRVDLLIDGWLIIEIDGDVKYEGPDAEAVRQAEFQRQKWIGNQGYVFLRYSPKFLLRHPEQFIAEVRRTLQSRNLRP